MSAGQRVELLRELRLLPLWRLRPAPAGVAAASYSLRDAEENASPDAAPRFDQAVVAEDAGRAGPLERAGRIAALDWSGFDADVAACTSCGLARTRNKTVPGVGDLRADWLFVGEAPGADEDEQGEPFVGQGGKLLDNMLAALGLERMRRVYIANVLKCRPPGNRAPEPAEVAACLPYLERQIALLQPGLIVALGRSAASTLLGSDASIAALRGRVHRYAGVPIIVTYHPAYLLRNPPEKAKAWEDLCLARATLRPRADGDLLQTGAAGPT